MKYTNLFGVEIEGLWTANIDTMHIPHTSVTTDGSIHISSSEYEDNTAKEREVQTSPQKLDATLQTIDALMPYLLYANATCGFHVHVSLKDRNDYFWLTQADFMPLFVKTMVRKFPELRKRTRNTYCKAKYSDDAGSIIQAQYVDKSKSGVRYHAVNFCNALHGTIEFRFFGAEQIVKDKDCLREYVLATYSFIEDYLAKVPKKRVIAELSANQYPSGELLKLPELS